MRLIILEIILLLHGVATSASSGDNDHNDHHGQPTDVFDVFYRHLEAKNNVLDRTDLVKLLKDLHLKDCHVGIGDCNTCFNVTHLLSWHNLTTPISEANFKTVLPGILYMLTQTASSCTDRDSTAELEVADAFQTFQSKYGDYGNSNDKSEESLANMMKKINNTYGGLLNKRKCFSAHDVLEESHVERGIRTEADLQNVAGYIVLQIFNKKCIHEEEHHNHKQLPNAHSFVDNVFVQFGNASSMSHEGFEKLYSLLHLGNKENKHGRSEEEHNHRRRKRRGISNDLMDECYDAEDILSIYNVGENQDLDVSKFQEICPSLVVQLKKKTCEKTKKKKEEIVKSIEAQTWKPWAGMFMSIAIVSLGSLSGIIAAPVSKKKWFPYLIMTLISLAVATLIGDAILHLFPHAVGLHQHKPGEHEHREEEGNPMLASDSFLWKSIALLCGIYMFFMFEVLMHAYGGGHSHSHGVEKHVTSSSTNNSVKVKGTLSMSEDTSVVYNTRIKSNSILRPSGLHECTPDNECSGCSEDGEDKSTCSSAQENLSAVDTITFPSSTDLHMPNSESQNVLVIDDFHHKNDKMDNQYHNHHHHEDHDHHESFSPSKMSSIAWMVLIGDAIHNFLDGIAIGVAFSEGWPDGLHGGISTSIAILCHELPHELGDFAVLLNSGLSIKHALVMNFISSLTAFVGGILGVSLGTQWDASNWIFAITAGMFIYIALVDMLPEILHSTNLKRRPAFCIFLANVGLLIGFGIMIMLGAWEEDIKSVLKN